MDLKSITQQKKKTGRMIGKNELVKSTSEMTHDTGLRTQSSPFVVSSTRELQEETR